MRSGIGIRHIIERVVGAIATLSLAACADTNLLPHESKTEGSLFQSYDQVKEAYSNIVPGSTQLSDLAKLGFDAAATANVEVLSNVDAIARFMPNDTLTFERLPKPVQACIEAQSRCSGLVFHLEHSQSQREGNIFLDAAGMKRETRSSGWSAEVVLLVQDDHVVYKLMSGRPHIAGIDDSEQPLGPLQDIGDTPSHSVH
jgi:hypothetical protein